MKNNFADSVRIQYTLVRGSGDRILHLLFNVYLKLNCKLFDCLLNKDFERVYVLNTRIANAIEHIFPFMPHDDEFGTCAFPRKHALTLTHIRISSHNLTLRIYSPRISEIVLRISHGKL